MLSDGFYIVNGDGSYSKFPAKFVSREAVGKSPIAPDRLKFSVSEALSEMEEIIYVVEGAHVFHGHLRTSSKRGAAFQCEALSSDWLLTYSYSPYYIFGAGQSTTDVFSDSETPFAAGDVPAFGFWYMVQSIVPSGLFVAYNSTTVILPGARNSPIYGKTLRCCNNYPDHASDETGAVTLALAGSIVSMAENTYIYVGDDLYIKFGDGSYGAGAFLVFADWWADRKIRSRLTDARTATKDFDLHGQAAERLDWILQGLGLEPEFLPHNTGKIYFNAAATISRGSASSPIRRFIDGVNCKVTIASRTHPLIQAAVGLLDNGTDTAKVDWDPKDIQLISVYDGKGDQKPEVDNYLNSVMAYNDLPVNVSFPGYDFFLKIGDIVSVSSAVLGTQFLGITKVLNQNNNTVLTIGAKPFSIKKAFGQLTRLETDPDMDLLSSKKITGGDDSSRTGNFTVKASDYAAGGLQVIYKETFSEATDGTDISRNAFIEILIGGVKIKPGRIKLESSVEINLTDFCSKSLVSNVVNSIERNIYNSTGWTPDADSIVVEQYKGTSFV